MCSIHVLPIDCLFRISPPCVAQNIKKMGKVEVFSKQDSNCDLKKFRLTCSSPSAKMVVNSFASLTVMPVMLLLSEVIGKKMKKKKICFQKKKNCSFWPRAFLTKTQQEFKNPPIAFHCSGRIPPPLA